MSSTPLNFAPYSDPPDSRTRWAPPPAPAQSSSSSTPIASSSYQQGASVSSLGPQTSFSSSSTRNNLAGGSGGGPLNTGMETTLGYRFDHEGPFAYLIGPFGAALLLILEVENDWVRFHAWQSLLLTGALVTGHLVLLVLGLSLLQYLLILCDLAAFGLMTLRAYRDADLLDRYELPVIGKLAHQWVEAE